MDGNNTQFNGNNENLNVLDNSQNTVGQVNSVNVDQAVPLHSVNINNVNQMSTKNGNNKNKKNVIIVICLVLVLLVGGFFVFKSVFNKQKTNDNSNNNESVKDSSDKNDNKKDDEEYKYSIVLYRSKDGYCIDKDSLCSEGSIELSVKHEDAKFESVVNLDKHYAIYTDAYVYLYDIDDEDSTKLSIEAKDYNEYDFVVNNKTKKVIGIFCGYREEESEDYVRTAFYNVNNEKLLYQGKYYNYEVAGNGYLSATLKNGSGDTEDDYTQYLLNQNKEEVLISKIGEHVKYSIEKSGNDYIIIETLDNNGELSSTIYTKSKNIIFKEKSNLLWSLDDGSIFMSDDNIVKKYNYSGITLKTSRDLHKVLHMMLNYALVIDSNNDLVLINIDSNKEYPVLSWKEDYYYYVDKSGYFDNDKAGIYLSIGLGDGDVDNDETIDKYYFDPKTNELSKIELKENDLD